MKSEECSNFRFFYFNVIPQKEKDDKEKSSIWEYFNTISKVKNEVKNE